MTHDLRAARDRLARYAGPDTPPFPPFKVGSEIASFTPGEVKRLIAQIAEGIRDTLAPDVLAVLAAPDLHARQAQEARVIALREISRPGAPMDPVVYEIYLATGGQPIGEKSGRVAPQAPESEPCMCYRDGCYVGAGGACTCALRGVQGCPCLAPAPKES